LTRGARLLQVLGAVLCLALLSLGLAPACRKEVVSTPASDSLGESLAQGAGAEAPFTAASSGRSSGSLRWSFPRLSVGPSQDGDCWVVEGRWVRPDGAEVAMAAAIYGKPGIRGVYGRVDAEPGKPVQFLLKEDKPPASIQVEVYSVAIYDSEPELGPSLASSTLTTLWGSPGAWRWEWTVPPEMERPLPKATLEQLLRVARVTVVWSESVWVTYHVGLELGYSSAQREGAVEVARQFSEALWFGDREGAQALMLEPPALSESPSDPNSFTSLELSAGWGLLAWNPRWGLLAWNPGFLVCDRDGLPRLTSANGLSGVVVTCEFNVRAEPVTGSGGTSSQPGEAAPANRGLYKFTETYGTVYTDGGWRVSIFRRDGIPCERAGGTQPGYASAVRSNGNNLRFGPVVSRYGTQVLWDSSGTRAALLVLGVDCYEVWVVDAPAASARLLFSVPAARKQTYLAGPMGKYSPEVRGLGWTGDGASVCLAVHGVQTCGSHMGEDGWWFAAVDIDGGQARSLAFLPMGPYKSNLTVAPDLSAAYVVEGPKMWRADLRTGTVSVAAEDTYLSLLDPSIAPDATAVLWVRRLIDLSSGSAVELRAPGLDCLLLAEGWTPDGLLVMAQSLTPETNIVRNESEAFGDRFFLVGAACLQIYGTGARLGEVAATVRPQGDESQRIGRLAWSPDGMALAFSAGPIVGEGQRLTHQPRELWVWDRRAGSYVKLADLPGSAGYFEWVSPTLLRLWGGSSGESGAPLEWRDFRLDPGNGYSLMRVTPYAAPEGFHRLGLTWKEKPLLYKGQAEATDLLMVTADGSLIPLGAGRRLSWVSQSDILPSDYVLVVDASREYGGLGGVFVDFLWLAEG